jgi:hypothetical protein
MRNPEMEALVSLFFVIIGLFLSFTFGQKTLKRRGRQEHQPQILVRIFNWGFQIFCSKKPNLLRRHFFGCPTKAQTFSYLERTPGLGHGVYSSLSALYFPTTSPSLPFSAHLFCLCSRGLKSPRILERILFGHEKAHALPPFSSRRLRSRATS